jgi:hypothetical protein
MPLPLLGVPLPSDHGGLQVDLLPVFSKCVMPGTRHIATLMSRGAGDLRYKGLDGAVVQMGMTVMANNGAVLVRIRQQRLSKRGQKFRRLLGLRRRSVNQINGSQF